MTLTLTNPKRATLLESLVRRAISQNVPASLTVVCQQIVTLVGAAGDTALTAEAARLVADLNASVAALQSTVTADNADVTADDAQIASLQAQITALSS